jgi:hypothetical protein
MQLVITNYVRTITRSNNSSIQALNSDSSTAFHITAVMDNHQVFGTCSCAISLSLFSSINNPELGETIIPMRLPELLRKMLESSSLRNSTRLKFEMSL